MFQALLKLVSPRPRAGQPLECVFSLNPEKRRLFLIDLKMILRLPDARLALPNVVNLETTIRRNRERIRIPHDCMLPLVKELLSVHHRIPPTSPLLEIMQAIPGLVNTVLTRPMPASASMDEREVSIRVGGIAPAEQEAEVRGIRKLIAENQPPLERKTGQDAPPAGVPGAPAALPADAGREHAPLRTSAGLTGNSRSMTALDQRNYLDRSADLIESVALSTQELSDEDFSGYVDLCILNGDQDRVIDMLVERVGEMPRAWAWARLLELAEAAGDPRFTELRERFQEWAARNHPPLLPVDGAAEADDLLYGVRREILTQLQRQELGGQNLH